MLRQTVALDDSDNVYSTF